MSARVDFSLGEGKFRGEGKDEKKYTSAESGDVVCRLDIPAISTPTPSLVLVTKELKRGLFTMPTDWDGYICGDCKSIFKNPHILNHRSGSKNCGIVRCESCWYQVLFSHSAADATCPDCRQIVSMSDLVPVLVVQQSVAKLRVKCVYRDKGCTEEVIFGIDGKNLADHLSRCRCRGRECTKCAMIVEWDNVDSHSSHCPRERITCDIDGECKVVVERQNLKEHRMKCNYRRTSCSFESVGCEWSGKYLHLNQHLERSIDEHNGLWRARVDALEKSLSEIKEENKKLKLDLKQEKKRVEEVKITMKRKLEAREHMTTCVVYRSGSPPTMVGEFDFKEMRWRISIDDGRLSLTNLTRDTRTKIRVSICLDNPLPVYTCSFINGFKKDVARIGHDVHAEILARAYIENLEGIPLTIS